MIKSIFGVILALLIFIVVWFTGNAALYLLDTLRENRNFLQDAFRELITPGLGAYLAMIGVDKVLKSYNRSVVFYGFSLILALVSAGSIYVMIITAKTAGFGIYDFTMQTLTPLVIIGAAYFAFKRIERE